MSHSGNSADSLFIAFQQLLAGRFSIDRELGRGGSGVLYLAREVHLDRLVAIKLLPPEHSVERAARERFLREARLAAKLSHPNIIPIHGVEDVGDFVFYVMAFVDGESLAHRVRTRGPLTSTEGARILREVAWALAYAHGQGLVHRDVKPDNILLERASGRVLVADFGIAAVAGDDAGDGISGTPEFMSPEQALGGDVGPRSDLYGLGATAFFAFTGQLPFEGATATEILARQVTEPPPPLASVATALPRKLASLVDRCLAKDPAHRPDSAQALADQLGMAIEKRRELPAALRAFVKRQSRLNGGGTLVAGVALLPAAISISSILGGSAGWSTLVLGVTAAPFGWFVAVARRLLTMGFAHDDIGPAFQREIEQAREELTVERHQGPGAVERQLPRVAKASFLAGIGFVGLVLAGGHPAGIPVEAFAVPSFALSVFSVLAFVGLRQRHRDIDTEFWASIWKGRIGRAAFAVAARLVGSRARGSAMTHRATELSLGMATEQLYESLPKESRHFLGELPALVRRLQKDAQTMRERHDGLVAALADAGERASADECAGLRATRDAVRDRLRDAVTALETIRLHLLRLHAGSGSVEGLTTHLGMAADMSAEIQRLAAAHDELAAEVPRRPTRLPSVATA